MTNQKPKILKKLGIFFSKVLQAPIIRGTIKSLPFGNLVYEIAENVKNAKSPEKKENGLPHSAVSLLAQLVFLSFIIYAFVTKQISIDDIMRYVTPNDFKVFGSGIPEVLNDSIPQ